MIQGNFPSVFLARGAVGLLAGSRSGSPLGLAGLVLTGWWNGRMWTWRECRGFLFVGSMSGWGGLVVHGWDIEGKGEGEGEKGSHMRRKK